MRQAPRKPLEQKFRSGFIWYPTLDPRTYNTFDLVSCHQCGSRFLLAPEIKRVTITDAYGEFVRFDLYNAARPLCAKCFRAPTLEAPVPTEAEIQFKEERVKIRRRGAEHERVSWKYLRTKVEAEMRIRGPLSALEIQEITKRNGSASIQSLIRIGLPLVPMGFTTREYGTYLAKHRVNLWGIQSETNAGNDTDSESSQADQAQHSERAAHQDGSGERKAESPVQLETEA